VIVAISRSHNTGGSVADRARQVAPCFRLHPDLDVTAAGLARITLVRHDHGTHDVQRRLRSFGGSQSDGSSIPRIRSPVLRWPQVHPRETVWKCSGGSTCAVTSPLRPSPYSSFSSAEADEWASRPDPDVARIWA
jgi:hypothetical protein